MGTQALADITKSEAQMETDLAAVVSTLKDLVAAIQMANGVDPAKVEALSQQMNTVLGKFEATLAQVNTEKPAISVSVSPATATVAVGATQQFSASVANAGDPSVTWKAVSGSVDANGLYAAPAAAATDTVTATSVEDATKSASATVTVQ